MPVDISKGLAYMELASSLASKAAFDACFTLWANFADLTFSTAVPRRPIESTKAVIKTSSKPNPFVRYIPFMETLYLNLGGECDYTNSISIFMLLFGKKWGMPMSLLVVVLAAGKGTRMGSSLPKPAHKVAGKPMFLWVVEAAAGLNPELISIVHGHQGEVLMGLAEERGLSWVHQELQLGTGHAVRVALENALDVKATQTLVLLGDMPLVTTEDINSLLEKTGPNDVGILSAQVTEPSGLGRVVCNPNGSVTKIVEHKDASASELEITEINTGVLIFPTQKLKLWMQSLVKSSSSGEYYLTSLIELVVASGVRVIAQQIPMTHALGINSHVDLAHAERQMQARQVKKLLQNGVRIFDPQRCDIRGNLVCGKDVSIDINCVFEGEVELGDEVYIEPNCVIRNSKIFAQAHIKANSIIDGAIIGAGCDVGPFARIRPKTVLKDRVKIGNFVETKNTTVAESSKINHLSYIGDAIVGSGVNIGAGTITCNYDGKNKHLTKINNGAFIGSGCQLIAPVEIGEGALLAAGTTLMEDAPAKKLTVNLKKQISKESKALLALQEKKDKTT